MDTIVPGAISAFVVDCTIFPLDTVKSRIQAEDFQKRYPGGRGLYKGLWQGFGPVVVATLPSAALFFTTYEHAKDALTSPNAPLIGAYNAVGDPRASAIAHTASSALAELASCLLLTPAETIKQQRQVAQAGSDVRQTLHTLSPSSLWRGYWALASRNLPFTAMQFPLYEFFRKQLAAAVNLPQRKGVRTQQRAAHQQEPTSYDDVDASDRARRRAYDVQQSNMGSSRTQGNGTLGVRSTHYAAAGLVSGASAACAGAISAFVTTPLDLVKTRIMLDTKQQQQQHPQASLSSSSSTGGVIRLMARIWRREGMRGLMRGAVLRSTWTALGAGIYLGSYEAGREWWGDAGKEQAQEAKEKAQDILKDVQVSS